MVFRSKGAHPPKEAAKAAPERAPERERTAETPPRKVQHSFINADTLMSDFKVPDEVFRSPFCRCRVFFVAGAHGRRRGRLERRLIEL